MTSNGSTEKSAVSISEIPLYFTVAVFSISIAPLLLMGLNVDFSSPSLALSSQDFAQASQTARFELMFSALSGAFTHTILEWSAFCIALFTVILAFVHYKITQDVTISIIAVALFLAGCMDAFHTLAADRLIEATADNQNLIPFTWALSRMFNALILMVGVIVLLIRKNAFPRFSNTVILLAFLISTSVIAYGLIQYAALSENLPQTQFPESVITRPYDVLPLVLYVISGTILFPIYYRRYKSLFAYTLILSMVPDIVLESHMAFGSSALFDAHFNVAHFLKIIAYAIPFAGLLFEYMETYRLKEYESEIRAKTERKLIAKTQQLEKSNRDLNDFAYIASHDLKSPLVGAKSLVSWIVEDNLDVLAEESKKHVSLLNNRLSRMERLLEDLLDYSRIGHKHGETSKVSICSLVSEVFRLLQLSDNFQLKCHSSFTEFSTLKTPLEVILRNLISNAIKHHDRAEGHITVTITENENAYHFTVEDDGPGIPSEHQNKIFEVFTTLQPRDETEGSGMGLSIVKKTLDYYHCRIAIESDGKRGTKVTFTWPKAPYFRSLDHV